MRTHQKGDAFIPLAADPFNQFKAGDKRHELRKWSKRWRSKFFPVGRRVTLSLGYSGERLYGTVRSYKIQEGWGIDVGFRNAVLKHYGGLPKIAVIGIDLEPSLSETTERKSDE